MHRVATRGTPHEGDDALVMLATFHALWPPTIDMARGARAAREWCEAQRVAREAIEAAARQPPPRAPTRLRERERVISDTVRVVRVTAGKRRAAERHRRMRKRIERLQEAHGTLSHSEIARRLGMARSTVQRVMGGVVWRWVTE